MRTSVLLITLDTTRADALGCYGAQPAVTPALDEIARRGVRYDQARTVAPITAPAHASMLTGLYPPRHGVRDNSLRALPQSARTSAELASAEGFATAAFVSAKVLDRAYGLDQGFALYSQPARESVFRDNPTFSTRSGRETAELAIEWLRGLEPGQAFFAWAHFFDPHQPWTTDPAELARAGGNPYLADVAAADDAVAMLWQALEELGRLESTAVIVVGDHGEGLGQHGEDTHGHMVFDSTLRVPFLVRYPGDERAGEHSAAIVSVADVHPTISEALGLALAPDLDGVSLWRRAPPAGRGAYFESYYGFLHFGLAPLAGWVDERGKYVHSSSPEFYAPLEQTDERTNVFAERAADVARCSSEIDAVAARPALAAGARLELDPQDLRELRALGYAASAGDDGELPHPLAASDRPSPHAAGDDVRRCQAAERAMLAGRHADAAAVLERLLEERPSNPFAWEMLGYCRLSLATPESAAQAFERALELGPERSSMHKGLGAARDALGDFDAAAAAWRRAVELDPADVEPIRSLHRLAASRGAAEEAAHWLERLRRARSER